NLRGILNFDRGNFVAAEGDFIQLATRYPQERSVAVLNLSEVLLHAGKYLSGLNRLSELIEELPNNDPQGGAAFVAKSALLLALNRDAEADEALAASKKLTQEKWMAYEFRCFVFSHLRDPDLAVPECGRAAAQSENNQCEATLYLAFAKYR